MTTSNLDKARQAEAAAGIGSGGEIPALPDTLDLDHLPLSVTATMTRLSEAVTKAESQVENVADALQSARGQAVAAWRTRSEYVARVGIAASPKAPARFAAYASVHKALAPDVALETFRTWYAAGFMILAKPDVSLSSDPARFAQTIGTKDAQAAYRASLNAADSFVAEETRKAESEAKAAVAKATKAADGGADVDLPKVEAAAAAKARKRIAKAKDRAPKVAAKATREAVTNTTKAATTKRQQQQAAKDRAAVGSRHVGVAVRAVSDVVARGSRNGWEDGQVDALRDALNAALAAMPAPAKAKATA